MPVFYRIVRTDPATLRDFLSLEEQERIPRSLPLRQRRLASGISMFDTSAAAAQIARQMQGRLGWFVASLTILEDDPRVPTYELTGANGHYTL